MGDKKENKSMYVQLPIHILQYCTVALNELYTIWKFKIFKAVFGNFSHTILIKIKFTRVVEFNLLVNSENLNLRKKRINCRNGIQKQKIPSSYTTDTIKWTSQVCDCGGGQMKKRHK